MTTIKGQEELDQYKLTRKEVADFLGITTNAVRMSQRGNNCHNLEYRFDGTKFLFKVPRRHPVTSMIRDHPSDHPRPPKSTHGATPELHKKIYNRGATHRGEDNYTSNALRMYNEGKILKNIEGKFKSPEHKKAFNEMTEAGFKEAYEISKRAKLKGTQENSRVSTPEVFPGGNANSFHQSHGKYGTMLNAQGIEAGNRKEYERADRKFDEENKTKYKQEYQNSMQLDGTVKKIRVNTRVLDFTPINSSFFIGKAPYDTATGEPDDPGSVEFTQYELDRHGPVQERRSDSFKSKVEEDTYRARKALYEKTGEIY
jgi:hypothetical protein|tara:strand:+ start:352 stop:1293 length:942 start_codon:yes stop_codon:yes gene_type:complete